MPSPKDIAEAYEHLTEKYPLSKTALDLIPYTGPVLAATDAAANIAKGNYGGAALDSLGVIPVVGKVAAKAIKSANLARTVGRGAEASDRAAKARSLYTGATGAMANFAPSDVAPSDIPYSDPSYDATGFVFKKGGKVSLSKKLKSSSKPKTKPRGDGIASRGKTRGRMV
jgi:hypothetical protein